MFWNQELVTARALQRPPSRSDAIRRRSENLLRIIYGVARFPNDSLMNGTEPTRKCLSLEFLHWHKCTRDVFLMAWCICVNSFSFEAIHHCNFHEMPRGEFEFNEKYTGNICQLARIFWHYRVPSLKIWYTFEIDCA